MSLSPFAPGNFVSRDGFGSPVPRQPAHLHAQAESYGIPPKFRGGALLFINCYKERCIRIAVCNVLCCKRRGDGRHIALRVVPEVRKFHSVSYCERGEEVRRQYYNDSIDLHRNTHA